MPAFGSANTNNQPPRALPPLEGGLKAAPEAHCSKATATAGMSSSTSASGPCTEFRRGVAFGMDVGNLFELGAPLQEGDGFRDPLPFVGHDACQQKLPQALLMRPSSFRVCSGSPGQFPRLRRQPRAPAPPRGRVLREGDAEHPWRSRLRGEGQVDAAFRSRVRPASAAPDRLPNHGALGDVANGERR